jgi:hypothetical protein
MMELPRGTAAKREITILGDSCPMSCAVDGSQIEFRFGDEASGLHLGMDGTALAKLLGLVVLMVERIKGLGPGTRADFVIRDVEIDRSQWPGG